MSECTERPSRAVACLLYVVAFGRLVYLWMKLLLCSSVAVATRVTLIAVGGVTPLIIKLHVGTRSGSTREKGGEEKEGGGEWKEEKWGGVWCEGRERRRGEEVSGERGGEGEGREGKWMDGVGERGEERERERVDTEVISTLMEPTKHETLISVYNTCPLLQRRGRWLNYKQPVDRAARLDT